MDVSWFGFTLADKWVVPGEVFEADVWLSWFCEAPFVSWCSVIIVSPGKLSDNMWIWACFYFGRFLGTKTTFILQNVDGLRFFIVFWHLSSRSNHIISLNTCIYLVKVDLNRNFSINVTLPCFSIRLSLVVFVHFYQTVKSWHLWQERDAV